MIYLNKVIEKWKSKRVVMEGCIVSEINEIEVNIAKEKLPLCYIEFLENTGKWMTDNPTNPNYYDYGSFVGNAVFYYNDLKLNNNEEGLIGLLQEDESPLTLPEKAFVFYGHQGYIYAFFKLNEGDNPPVYGYEEGYEGASFPKIADSLSSFYERYIDGDKTLFAELRE